MVETLPFNAGGVDSIPGQGGRILHALQPRNHSITNSVKTFKMVHIKKKKKEKKNFLKKKC